MKILLPENIDLNYPKRYILSIRIHPEQYSFSLYNPIDDGSYFYQVIEGDKHQDAFTNFKNVFFENDFFTLPFRKQIILNYSPAFTYVPSLIYRDKDKESYFKFLSSEHSLKILDHQLQSSELTVLHQLPEEVYDFFHRSFVQPEFFHHTAPLIAYFQERSKVVSASQMIVNVHRKGLDIICFSRTKFVLGNHFPFQQIEDAIYYILFTWSQLKFNQTRDFIYIAGDQSAKKPLMEKLKLYIHNIIPVNITPEAHFDRIDTHSIPFEHAALSLCEL